MPDAIELRGIRLLGRHGVLDFEKHHAQPFEVDLDLITDVATPARTDRIEDAVSYCDVLDKVKRVITEEQHELIERLATRIADEVLEDTRITSVTVTLRKLQPAVAVDLASAAIRIQRP